MRHRRTTLRPSPRPSPPGEREIRSAFGAYFHAKLVEGRVLGRGLSARRRIEDEDALAGWAMQGRGLAGRLPRWCRANGYEDAGRCGVPPRGLVTDLAIEQCLAPGRGPELVARPVWDGAVREIGALAGVTTVAPGAAAINSRLPV